MPPPPPFMREREAMFPGEASCCPPTLTVSVNTRKECISFAYTYALCMTNSIGRHIYSIHPALFNSPLSLQGPAKGLEPCRQPSPHQQLEERREHGVSHSSSLHFISFDAYISSGFPCGLLSVCVACTAQRRAERQLWPTAPIHWTSCQHCQFRWAC